MMTGIDRRSTIDHHFPTSSSFSSCITLCVPSLLARECGQSGEPNQSGGDRNECFEPGVEFVVARSDTAKLLQAGKEPFDEISAFINMLVIASEHLPIGFRRNDGRGVHCLDTVNEAGGVKRLVGYDSAHVLHAIDEIGGFGDVVSFASCQTETRQIAQTINRCMNLGAQAPTRTAKTLLPVFLGAPAACWCARTIVLSRNTSSKSASSQSLAKSACQTPLSAQREKRRKAVFHGPKSAGRSRQGALFLPSREPLQQTSDYLRRCAHDLLPCHAASVRFVATGRHVTAISASRPQPKRQDVNTINPL